MKATGQPPPPPTVRTAQALDRWLEGLGVNPNESVWLYYLIARDTRDAADIHFRHPAVRAEVHPLPVFSFRRRVQRVDIEQVSGWFVIVPTEIDGLYRLITVMSRLVWSLGLSPIIRHEYPRVSSMNFMQRELRRAINSLRDRVTDAEKLKLVRASIRERIVADKTARSSRRYRSDVVYTEEDIENAFDIAQERAQWFKTLTIEIEKLTQRQDSILVAELTLSNEGWMAWAPFIERYHQPVQDVLIDAAGERLGVLSNRGIQEREYQAGRPIALDFESSVFEDRKTLRTLTSVMVKYPRSVRALLHQNPYFHMTVADDADGSSFDLWVLNPRRLLVVPGLRASEASLNRLIGYLSENFRDVRVADYEPNAWA